MALTDAARTVSDEPLEFGAERAKERLPRLEALVRLRRVYRNFLVAARLVAEGVPGAAADAAEPVVGGDDDDEAYAEWLEGRVKRLEAAGEAKKKLQASVDSARDGLAILFTEDSGDEAARVIEAEAKKACADLTRVAEQALAALPFATAEAAREALDAARLRLRAQEEESGRSVVESIGEGLGRVGSTLEAAEETLGQSLSALREAPVQTLSTVGRFTRDTWVRINGGTPDEESVSSSEVLRSLPTPSSSRAACQERSVRFAIRLERLDRALTERSRQREKRLRRADSLDRVRLARELRDMDDAVSELRRKLAVCTLLAETERIYLYLEEELLEVTEQGQFRDQELTLLTAEYSVAYKMLAQMTRLIERDEAILIADDELARLARDIPELEARLGLDESPALDLSMDVLAEKVRTSAQDSLRKVEDGVGFVARGVQLLGIDLSSSAQLFVNAAFGDTLKPREVQTIRRTTKDVLTFIPFAIILITPLTPIGHVLVFSFIQTYFPNLFPSQFTERRQELMKRYEELQRQLQEAEGMAEMAAERAAYELAAATVAKLTRGGPSAAEPALAASTAVADLEEDAVVEELRARAEEAADRVGGSWDDGEPTVVEKKTQ